MHLTVLLFFTLLPLVLPGYSAAANLELSIGVGHRIDQFDWNIAGTQSGTSPNVLSELIWKDLEICQARIGATLTLTEVSFARVVPELTGSFGYGSIVGGTNSDSDYRGDDRTSMTARSINNSDDGRIVDLSLGIGFKIPFMDQRMSITPGIGYSMHRQNLSLTNGMQTWPTEKPIDGLDSSYRTRWESFWVGLGYKVRVLQKLTLYGESSYHDLKYSAVADWNLRPDFAHPISFDHHGDGDGWTHEVGMTYQHKPNIAMTVALTRKKWEITAGRDRLYLAEGHFVDTRLNAVHWESMEVSTEISFVFD